MTDIAPSGPRSGDASTAVLLDGTTVEIRQIRPEDVDDLLRFHDDLSFGTVYRRFFGVHPHLGAAEARHFCVLDEPGRFALVARIGTAIVGVARMEPGDTATSAEVAFVVSDHLQQHGLGRLLARRLAAEAGNRGITELVADVLSDNRPMLRLLPDAGLPITVSYSSGVARVVCRLPAATTTSRT